ncbi:hypothetical protein RF11_06365 [Thelohanellus kitauei]|uniref:ISXO2-like transposase domain-containing protein n=1 Tax=Thelohanellus kitauei TaxID=669202 RepID=A0A0C2JAK7_THEKT|nr:hypothetical protein RF11_06365 [Thelohanellus kitauei]
MKHLQAIPILVFLHTKNSSDNCGDNIEVKIDESKLGKHKDHRCHTVSGVWVLGGIERTVECHVFLVEVPDRTAETLLRIIRTNVLPESIIITDVFRSSNHLSRFYNHQTSDLKYQISPRSSTNSMDENGNVVENLLDDNL